MTNRTTKLASAILIGALAGAFLAVGGTPLQAAGACLSGPKGPAPEGSHWYYRIDHTTKRNCWYVRAEGGQAKSAHASGTPALPQAQAPLQPSVANAHAQASPADIGQSNEVAAQSVPSAPQDNGQGSNPLVTDNGQTSVASRWIEQTGTVDATPPQSDDSRATLNSSTPPAAAPPLAATDRRSASPSVLTLVLVLIGALASAGVFGSVIFNFGRARRNYRHDSRREQRTPWDSIDVGASIQSPPLATREPTPQAGRASDRHEPVIPDEIVQLLARLSKEATA